MNSHWQSVLLKVLLGIVIISVAAQVAVTLPISKGIPFTAQSLVVFVLAGILDPKSFLSVILGYLLLGIIGLPVFAEGSSGWSKLVGSTGGFLYGFVLSGLAISCLLNKFISGSWSRYLGAMLLGTILLFICGLGQLAWKFGPIKALEYGLFPFWKMALLKALLAAIIVFFINKAPKPKIIT